MSGFGFAVARGRYRRPSVGRVWSRVRPSLRSMDELPHLLKVFIGDQTLVGPRLGTTAYLTPITVLRRQTCTQS
jgi:lipopolysaccharide/colanic/teichoic acid biosynthesis glycosyltransferase